jgi:hypothetical protein
MPVNQPFVVEISAPVFSNFSITNHTTSYEICDITVTVSASQKQGTEFNYSFVLYHDYFGVIENASGTSFNGTITFNITNCLFLGNNYTLFINGSVGSNYTNNFLVFRTEECCASGVGVGDNMEITFGEGIIGIFLTLVIFLIAFYVDKEDNDTIWKPLLLLIDSPISLVVGLYYMNTSLFSINYWIGLIFILFAVILSFAGLYYSLNFGRK